VTAQAADRPGRFHSAADFHAAYRSGALSPLQVVEALLPLVQRGQNPPSKFELAWTANNVDEILAEARASTARWAEGKPLGVLDGVPIGVKCDVKMEGYVAHCGLKIVKEYPYFAPAKETAWPIQKLREAGAVVVGQNNMHEIGMGKFLAFIRPHRRID
jgi:Asp-tRNA(Asn)/Glu-tRNA(Gln) amidotransferase A subunit family amidase